IVMACLNLPPYERYRDENIYLVALLPGKHQQVDCNPLLKPLVEDLLRYWETGAYFTGVPNFPEPRLIRCALVQLICDLPAARKIAGFIGHSATYFCSICQTSTGQIEDLESFNEPQKQRESRNHMKHALEYKRWVDEYGMEVAEKKLQPKGGPQHVRWSILNDLPYWDPIRCTILDVMHMILLGLCKFHWQ
ncbi:hypothetical protein M408DRAFT_31809, partial [Serendipita vermifera MAFF 305830]